MCGFGSALVCMSVLGYIMDYKEALPVMTVASAMLNASLLIKTYRHIQWKILWLPAMFSLLGRIFGMAVFNHFESAILSVALGLMIMATAVFQWRCANRISIRPTYRNGAVAGILSGALGGISSAGGPPMVVYYMNLGLDKYEYVATMQMTFLLGSLFSVGMLTAGGYYTAGIVQYSAVAVAGILSGGFLGLKLLARISKEPLW